MQLEKAGRAISCACILLERPGARKRTFDISKVAPSLQLSAFLQLAFYQAVELSDIIAGAISQTAIYLHRGKDLCSIHIDGDYRGDCSGIGLERPLTAPAATYDLAKISAPDSRHGVDLLLRRIFLVRRRLAQKNWPLIV